MLTQAQAIEYLSKKLRMTKLVMSGKKSKADEARDILNKIILSHIEMPTPLYQGESGIMQYIKKLRYMALMIRRIIDALNDPTKLDDKDYYGNKRLELAGSLISLLFEDLFKKFAFDVKKIVDKELPK